MGIEIIGKLTQKNNGDFKLVDLEDVDYDGTGKNAKEALQTLIGQCVQKEAGKGLSTNDYTAAEKEKLSALENYDDSEIKTSINNKADKNEVFTMANMGQDIKEAMTGGSVAVVGKNTILTENILDGQITYNKTDFIELDTSVNLFDGNFKTGFTLNSAYKIASSDTSRRLIVLKIKPNTTYSIIRESSSLFRIATHTKETFNIGDSLDGSIQWTGGSVNLNKVITTGENDVLLVAILSYTNENPFVQVLEGNFTDFTCNYYPYNSKLFYTKQQSYSSEEIDTFLTNKQDAKKVKVIKTTNCLNIYVPSKKNDNYLHYKYCLVNKPTINMNCWRVLSMNVVNSNFELITPWIQDVEWEGVLQEKDTSDFLGGFHGDETLESINCIIDGNEIDLDGTDFALDVNNKIIITVKSVLNRCNTTGDNLLTRYKISTWDKNNYTVENKWVALQSFTLVKCYQTMLSMLKDDNNGKDIVAYGRYDYDYYKTPAKGSEIEGCVVNRKDVKMFEFWGETSGVYAKVESVYDDKYPNRKQFASRNQQPNIFKAYFDLTGEYKVVKDEVLQGKSIYTIEI